jgi:hypothetical protein
MIAQAATAQAAIARTTEILPNILGNSSMLLNITFKRNITFEQTPPESWGANGRRVGEMTEVLDSRHRSFLPHGLKSHAVR